MKLKDTIYTPSTSFSMRANASIREKEIIKKWNKDQVYKEILRKNKGNKNYFIHHGPPYANGEIHIGHCLNAILKEFVQRTKLQQSYYAPMIFGWDTHGLPIEHALLKKHKDYAKLSILEFRQKCREYAMTQVNIQMDSFKRLGLVIDFEKNYYTMDKQYEASQVKIFHNFLLNNYIYRANKPIIWSWSSRSALADAEVEYLDISSPSVYLLVKVREFKNRSENLHILIWTTTPWTLPSNKAIAYSEKFEYVVAIDKFKRKIILSKEALERLKLKLELIFHSRLDNELFKGTTYLSPITKQICPLLKGHHLERNQGSGFVHIAPGHGKDDYIIGIKNNLEIFSGVDEKGIMTDAKYQGIFYKKADDLIIADLKKEKAILSHEIIKHSYPTDWRTGKPVIFRATTQWFINVKLIKKELIKQIKKVIWIQPWAKTRMIDMINNRDDWCISRQRRWGVPIVIYYDHFDNPILDKKLFNVVEKFFLENGTDIYYDPEFEKMISYKNDHIKKLLKNVSRKELDIMDVWLDSGISHYTVMKKEFNITQSDLYLEGTDQFRGWFNSSLITSFMINNLAPYKQVITHGFIVDKNGRKMSKSKGNGIPVNKLLNRYGADIIRLFFANSDYNDDIRISIDTLDQISNQYRKIRNVFRFLLGNLNGFTKDYKVSKLNHIDTYILINLNNLIEAVKNDYDTFNYKAAIKALNNFIINDLSSLYFEISKDILYINDMNHIRKRQILTVFSIVLDRLIRVIAPILPFLAEDVYQHAIHLDKTHLKSVHLLGAAKPVKISGQQDVICKQMAKLLKLKKALNSKVDEEIKKGNCKKISEVSCTIFDKSLLNFFPLEEITEILQIAETKLVDGKPGRIKTKTIEKFYIQVDKTLIKCDRCWSYCTKINTIMKNDKKYQICENCVNILNRNFKNWE